MNDFLVTEIYKNTQRLRVKNQVEEKLLREIVDGHKGYREKLNKSLNKLDQTRRLIEHDYVHMKKEMRALGLNPPQTPPVSRKTSLTDAAQTTATTETRQSSSYCERLLSSGSSRSSSSNSSANVELPRLVKPLEMNSAEQQNAGLRRRSSVVAPSSLSKKPSLLLAGPRRVSTIGVGAAATTNVHRTLLSSLPRRFSLDQQRPPPASQAANSTASFIKSLRKPIQQQHQPPRCTIARTKSRSNETADVDTTDATSWNLHETTFDFESASKVESDFNAAESTYGGGGLNATLSSNGDSSNNHSISNKLSPHAAASGRSSAQHAQIPHTPLSPRTNLSFKIPNYSSSSSSGSERNTGVISSSARVSHLSGVSMRRGSLNGGSVISSSLMATPATAAVCFPQLQRQHGGTNLSSSSSSSKVLHNPSGCQLGESTRSRRVSFGHVELSQLDIPVLYKHSNVGYERYKLDPRFYLPDGSLRRKYSLPKLSDTLVAVSQCEYLRRHSLESVPLSENEVRNIFKDLQPTQAELRHFDIVAGDKQPLPR